MPLPLLGIALGLAAEFVPSLIGALAGDKAEQVAETVVGAAKTITGQDDPAAAAAALRADPELALRFKQEMLAHERALFEIEVGDRQDARERDVKLAEMGKGNLRANLMIVGDVVGLVLIIAGMIFFGDQIVGELKGLLIAIASYFGLGLRDAHQFEFGSSRGSKEKDLARQLGK